MSLLLKNILYTVGLQVLNLLFPLITAPYIARILLPEGVGVVNFVITYVSYFVLLAGVGIPVYGIREIAKEINEEKRNLIFNELFSISFWASLFFSIIYLSSILLIDELSINETLYIVGGVSLYLGAFSIDWLFQGMEQFKIITIRSLIGKGVSLVLLFSLVHDKNDVFIYIIIISFSTLFNQLWNWFTLRKNNIKVSLVFSWSRLQRHFSSLKILYLSSLAASVYIMLDTLMLGFISTYEDVGFYTSSLKVIRILLSALLSLGLVLLPRIGHLLMENKMDELSLLFCKSFNLIVSVVFPVTITIFLFSSDFIPFFFGAGYEKCISIMKIQSIILLFIPLSNLFSSVFLLNFHKEGVILRNLVIAMLVNVLLNFFLIPNYAGLGASWASVSAEFVMLVVSVISCRKYLHIDFLRFKEFAVNLLVVLSMFCIYWGVLKFMKTFCWQALVYSLLSLISFVFIHCKFDTAISKIMKGEYTRVTTRVRSFL